MDGLALDTPLPVIHINAEKIAVVNLKRNVLKQWQQVSQFLKAKRAGRAQSETVKKLGRANKNKVQRQPTLWKIELDNPAIVKARSMTVGMDDPIVFSTLKHGMALEAMGSMEGAARMYAMAVGMSPANIEILSNYARVLKHLRDFKTSRHCYEKVLEHEPKNFSALNNLAILSVHEGRNAEALELFQRALKINPSHRETISNLARFQHTTLGNHKLAEQLYIKALMLQPKSGQALTDLADFQITVRGEVFIARRLLQKAIKTEPEYTRAKELLACTEEVTEICTEAGKQLEQRLLSIQELNWAEQHRRRKIHVVSSQEAETKQAARFMMTLFPGSTMTATQNEGADAKQGRAAGSNRLLTEDIDEGADEDMDGEVSPAESPAGKPDKEPSRDARSMQNRRQHVHPSVTNEAVNATLFICFQHLRALLSSRRDHRAAFLALYSAACSARRTTPLALPALRHLLIPPNTQHAARGRLDLSNVQMHGKDWKCLLPVLARGGEGDATVGGERAHRGGERGEDVCSRLDEVVAALDVEAVWSVNLSGMSVTPATLTSLGHALRWPVADAHKKSSATRHPAQTNEAKEEGEEERVREEIEGVRAITLRRCALTRSHVSALRGICEKWGKLRELDLSHNRLGDQGGAELIASLPARGLEKLSLSDNGLGQLSGEALGAFLSSSSALSSIDISWNSTVHATPLRNVSYRLGTVPVPMYFGPSRAEHLPSTCHVNRLEGDLWPEGSQAFDEKAVLRWNAVGDSEGGQGPAQLGGLLSDARRTPMQLLDLAHNRISHQGAEAVDKAWKGDEGGVVRLVLDGNPMTDDGVAAMAAAVEQRKSRLAVSMEGCGGKEAVPRDDADGRSSRMSLGAERTRADGEGGQGRRSDTLLPPVA